MSLNVSPKHESLSEAVMLDKRLDHNARTCNHVCGRASPIKSFSSYVYKSIAIARLKSKSKKKMSTKNGL